jgi:hypothetical protein
VSVTDTGGAAVDEAGWDRIAREWRKRDFSELRERLGSLDGVPVGELDRDGLFGDAPLPLLEEALAAAARADRLGPVLVALYVYGRCLDRWEKSAEYVRIEEALRALAQAAGPLRSGEELDEDAAELLTLAVDHAQHLINAMKVENSVQCSCPVQMSHYAELVVEQTQPLLSRAHDGEAGPWTVLRSDLEIAGTYFNALKVTGEAMEEFLGPPVTGNLEGAIAALERAEGDESIAGDVYQSELRAHLATVRGLNESAAEPWIQIDEAKLVYIYPFALTSNEGQESVLSDDLLVGIDRMLSEAKRATTWSVGDLGVTPIAALDTQLSDLWEHADPPDRVYGGVTIRLPDVIVESKDRVVEDKYTFAPPLLHTEVRLSRLGNHYLRIATDLEDADLHEVNQALRRGSGSMGEEELRCAGCDRGWARLVSSDNTPGYVEDVLEGVADCLGATIVGDPGGGVHVVVDIRKASRQGDPAGTTLSDDELMRDIGATLLFHPVGDFAISLEEWVRYPPVDDTDNLMDGAGRVGDLIARTADTTILYLPTSPDWLCGEFAEMVEFIASIPPLLTTWEKEITTHARTLERRLEKIKESVHQPPGEREFDLGDIHGDEADLHELRAEVRRELANLHSPRLVWNRSTRSFLDRLWAAAGLPALEDGLERQLEVIASQQQRLVAIAGEIAEENRQATERRQARLARVLEFGLTVIAATSLAGLFSWINADYSLRDDTMLAFEAAILITVVVVLGVLLYMSKRSE